MTPSILSLTFNDLTSLNRAKPEINTSKSKTAPLRLFNNKSVLTVFFGSNKMLSAVFLIKFGESATFN